MKTLRYTGEQRIISIDILKGFLILCVVLAHYAEDRLHDVIFLFHMPLFFMISGFLTDREKITDDKYLKRKTGQLLLPYTVYLLADLLLVRRTYSWKFLAGAIWGGRCLSGVYWYITCYLSALWLFRFLLGRNRSDRKTMQWILGFGAAAVVESHISEYLPRLASPGIPWSMDTALLAVVYLSAGFYGKKFIRYWLTTKERKADAAAAATALMLLIFCILNSRYELYYFDMKPLYYKELASAILIPCAFGAILVRLFRNRCPDGRDDTGAAAGIGGNSKPVRRTVQTGLLICLNRGLAFLGRNTLPILFLHVPLNTLIGGFLEYGRLLYVVIGIGIPAAISLIFGRFRVMRILLGLPGER